jgi:hypothetical protein
MNIPNNETVYNLNMEIMEDSFIFFLMFSIIIFCKFVCCKKRIVIDNESLRDEINSLREEESSEENLTPPNLKIEKSNNSKNSEDDLPSYSDIYPEKYKVNHTNKQMIE